MLVIVNIKTNAPYSKWKAFSSSDWINISKSEDYIVIKHKVNDEFCDNDDKTRSAYITLACDDRDGIRERIKIVQPESKEIPKIKIRNISIEKKKENL